MHSGRTFRIVGLLALLACGWAFLALTLTPSPAAAQETPKEKPKPATMPEGWKQLDAAKFAEATEKMLKARPRATSAHVKEVTQHAWDTFLNDEKFIAEGDWATVRTLMSRFLGRRKLLVAGENTEALATSQKQMDERVATLKTRTEARLEADPGSLNKSSFKDFRAAIRLMKGLKTDLAKRVDCHAAWMKANDWRELAIEDQSALFQSLAFTDLVDSKCLSVRWTGKLKAPADGTYRFEQARTYYTDGKMKLSINGQVVLDSPGVRHETDCYCEIQPDVAKEKYLSSPVTLRAGQPVEFRLDYVHDMTGAKLRGIYPMGFPVAILTWRSETVPQQIVPSQAFTPPEGFGETGETGLKGEYFADAKFGGKKVTRLDSAIDFVWQHRSPVCAKYASERAQLAKAMLPKVTSPTYLASRLDPKDKAARGFTTHGISQLLEGLPPSERLQAIRTLAGQPGLLKHLRFANIHRYMCALCMVPGKEHLELLAAWSKTQEPPKSWVARFNGWRSHFARGTYERGNYMGPWKLGRVLCRAYFDDCEAIWKNHLELPNGDCNLTLAYATTFATKLTRGKNGRIREVLDEALADENLKGDRRMTWLLARAYAEEVAIARKPRPGRGNKYLKEALAAAESPEYRFWALQELVARLAACNRCAEGTTLINSLKGQFGDESQQKAMAVWLKRLERLPKYYAGLQDKVRQSSIDAYKAEMLRRIAKAEARGDDKLAARYRKMIGDGEQQKAKATKSVLEP